MKIGNHQQAAIVVPQISNLEGLISEVIGAGPAKLLAKNKEIKLDPETIRLFTRQHPPRSFRGPLLVAFTPISQLKSVVRDNPGASIIFVPWASEERDFYVDAYSPEVVP